MSNRVALTTFLLLNLLPALLAVREAQPLAPELPVPLGLHAIPWPEDNPYSPARAELGKLLFFDGRLSSNGIVSCAFCHEPGHAFSASTTFSKGVSGKPGKRHTPTLINRAWGKSQFWDGRSPTLESQVIVPVTNPDEMGMAVDRVVHRLKKSIEEARRAGYLPSRKIRVALDTTPILGKGAVKDTYNLLAEGMVKLAGRLC